MYIARQYILPVLQMIYPTVYWIIPPGCPTEPQSHPIPNRVYQLLPKAGTSSGFFTVVTGTTTLPIKPNTWEPPMISSASIYVQVIFLSSKHLLSL